MLLFLPVSQIYSSPLGQSQFFAAQDLPLWGVSLVLISGNTQAEQITQNFTPMFFCINLCFSCNKTVFLQNLFSSIFFRFLHFFDKQLLVIGNWGLIYYGGYKYRWNNTTTRSDISYENIYKTDTLKMLNFNYLCLY